MEWSKEYWALKSENLGKSVLNILLLIYLTGGRHLKLSEVNFPHLSDRNTRASLHWLRHKVTVKKTMHVFPYNELLIY